MELIVPSTIQLTFGAIVVLLGGVFAAMRAYLSLRNNITDRFRHLEDKFDAMTARNERADRETEKVKAEQSKQETTIAVMAEQMRGISLTLTRVDGNVDELVKRGVWRNGKE